VEVFSLPSFTTIIYIYLGKHA